jgi:hypothetical protein
MPVAVPGCGAGGQADEFVFVNGRKRMNFFGKSTLAVSALLAVLSTGGCSSPVETPLSTSQANDGAWRDWIPETSHLFAVIESVEGDQVALRTLNEVSAPNSRVYLSANSLVAATAFPTTTPNATRQEVCVTKVQPLNPFGDGFSQVDLVRENSFVERHGLRCIASVADFRGATGVPVGTLKPETVVTVRLNGDWRLEQ